MAHHRRAVGVVRAWQFDHAEGHTEPMNAASLVKQVIGHLALAIIDDVDEPIHGDITARHVLSHTTGLPNWRPKTQPLTPLRPPGTRWGYSGEGFVLLQDHLEQRTGERIQDLAQSRVFEPLGMNDSHLGDPEPGYHGYRPLMTTAADYARFLAHTLTINDERWQPQVRIDEELAWGAGWGLETGRSTYGWQWGLNPDASNFVIGNPLTGDGVVVLTDDPNGREYYTQVVNEVLPGDHPSLRVEHNQTFIALVAE